jgi:riboflavin biosynthesis pyrimidine reductase
MNGSAVAADRRIARLFGVNFEAGDTGVLQVAAIWGPERRFMNIRPGSPASETDRFVLSLARARADAIITTGSILRAEPHVTHDIDDVDLRAFRRECLGKKDEPISLVLTSGRDLDGSHPIFQSGRARAYTAARSLPGIGVVHDPSPSLARAIRYLEDERRCQLITLEIGPSATREAFAEPALVTELLLSVFQEPWLDTAYRGGAFPSDEKVHQLFPIQTPPFESREESGRWRFCLYRQR